MLSNPINNTENGIITCIPKGDKPRHILQTGGHCTLLNTVYKIASGSIAIRLRKYLRNRIQMYDHTGFITDRCIGENSRFICDIMHFAENNNIPGL